jgi:ring-1,2-phenylacetyl-CoA epoxidase subunit PaaD
VPLVLTSRRTAVPCPRCGSADTEETSRFAATSCKALWRCRACLEPFEYVKEI